MRRDGILYPQRATARGLTALAKRATATVVAAAKRAGVGVGSHMVAVGEQVWKQNGGEFAHGVVVVVQGAVH